MMPISRKPLHYYRDNLEANMKPVVFALIVFTMSVVWAAPPEGFSVSPIAETAPVISMDDAADDPAIWFNSNQPEKSLIIGTDKKSGVDIFDLQGNRLQRIDSGRINNIDIRGRLVMGSNRTENHMSAWWVNASGEGLTAAKLTGDRSKIAKVYGFCMGHKAGHTYAFLNGKDGSYEQYLITVHPDLSIQASLKRTWKIDTQVEGCVFDDQTGQLYIGEENKGVWKFDIEHLSTGAGDLLVKIGENGLTADVEGLALYAPTENTGYFVVSSQGSNEYFLYQREDFAFVSKFRVVDDQEKGIDGSSETDGLEVSAQYFSEQFPKGMLVVQDGHNTQPEEKQNFKIIDWRQIKKKLSKHPQH